MLKKDKVMEKSLKTRHVIMAKLFLIEKESPETFEIIVKKIRSVYDEVVFKKR